MGSAVLSRKLFQANGFVGELPLIYYEKCVGRLLVEVQAMDGANQNAPASNTTQDSSLSASGMQAADEADQSKSKRHGAIGVNRPVGVDDVGDSMVVTDSGSIKFTVS